MAQWGKCYNCKNVTDKCRIALCMKDNDDCDNYVKRKEKYMKEQYKDFIIAENTMKIIYGDKRSEITNYLVYQEIDGEKYFLPDVTAYDSIEEAKMKIDELIKPAKFVTKIAIDVVNRETGTSIETLIVTEDSDEACRVMDNWNSKNATDTISADIFYIEDESQYNNDRVKNGYVIIKE